MHDVCRQKQQICCVHILFHFVDILNMDNITFLWFFNCKNKIELVFNYVSNKIHYPLMLKCIYGPWLKLQ